MSVHSLGILSPLQTDSSISLLSHSDTSYSTDDSLNRSRDAFDLDDDAIQSSLHAPESSDPLRDILLNPLKAKKRPEKFSETLDNAMKENDTQNKENSKETNNNETDETGQSETNGKKTSSSNMAARSKLPKSKTFDTASVFNSRGAQSLFHADDPMSRSQGSKNHVFMTSHECMVVPGCSKLPRETIASRLRFEKQHSGERGGPHASSANLGEGYHKGCITDGYQTPSQRKDILLRDLKRQVRDLKCTCEAKDREIAMYKQHVDEETSKLVQSKDGEIEKLREELAQVKQSYDDISSFCEESIAAASMLEQKAADLKNAMTDRERQHQKIYLEMYKKGQDSARFEREEELERLATGGCKVTISELVKKLAWTELELAKWQTIRRQESYQDAMRPETEADATLRFLKDSFFHYITDERESDHHLRAIIKIFKYTEPQMLKIKQSKLIELIDKKYKKKSKR